MEGSNAQVALEKNETARREITEVKAETIMTINADSGFSSKNQVCFYHLIFSLVLCNFKTVTPPTRKHMGRAPKLGEIGRINSTTKNGRMIFASNNVSLEAPSFDFGDVSSIDE